MGWAGRDYRAPGSKAHVAAFLQWPWELGQKPVTDAGRGLGGGPLQQIGTVAVRAIEPEARPVLWAPGPGAPARPPASGSSRLFLRSFTSRQQGFDHLLPRPPPSLAWISVRVAQQVSLCLPYCVFLPDRQPECCLYRGGQIQTLAAAPTAPTAEPELWGGPHSPTAPHPSAPDLTLLSAPAPLRNPGPDQPAPNPHTSELSAQLLGGCARPKGTAVALCVSRTQYSAPREC